MMIANTERNYYYLGNCVLFMIDYVVSLHSTGLLKKNNSMTCILCTFSSKSNTSREFQTH